LHALLSWRNVAHLPLILLLDNCQHDTMTTRGVIKVEKWVEITFLSVPTWVSTMRFSFNIFWLAICQSASHF
jgi:hypothetical protein